MTTKERTHLNTIIEDISVIRNKISDIHDISEKIVIDDRKLNIGRYTDAIEQELQNVEYNINRSLNEIEHEENFTVNICEKCGREVESWALIEHRTNSHSSISHRIGNFHTTKIMSDYVLSMLEGKTLDDVDEIVCRNLCSNRYYRGNKYFNKMIEHIRHTKDVKHYPEKEFNTRPYWLKH